MTRASGAQQPRTLGRVRGALYHARRALGLTAVAFVVMFPAEGALPEAPAPRATPPGIPEGARIASDRSYKLDLIDKLPKPPEVIIFGGSRATRFDPDDFKRLTGLTAFNCAFSNGRPTDHWAIARYCIARHPNVKLRCIWAVQPSLFYEKPMDPGLVQDERLSAAFDQQTIDEAAREQVATMGQDRPMLWYPGCYSPDGQLLHNWYDERMAAGQTLDEAIRHWVWLTRATARSTAYRRAGWSLNQRCFGQALAMFNSIGVRPVILVMPTHPDAIAGLGEEHWQEQRSHFLQNLRALQQRYQFAIVDYSRIERFDGQPNDFYDGVHVNAANSRRILTALVRDVPQAFADR